MTHRTSLTQFVASLDTALSAAQMFDAAERAGYKTTLPSIYAARTRLGLAKARSRYERKTPAKPAMPPLTEFTPPSDEAILGSLIVRVGLERARAVFARVERRLEDLAV